VNGRERVLTALSGGRPDRVPVGPFVGYAAAPLVGASLREYYTRGETIARAQVELGKRVGHDILLTAADTYYIAEGFGLRTRHDENALPTVVAPLLGTLADADRLSVPNPERDGRMPVYLEALRELRRLSAGSHALRGTGTGPFSLAAYLYGEEPFLTLLAEIAMGEAEVGEERRLRELLEITTATTIAFLEAQLDIGLDIVYMGDSLASADMISPEMYRTWAFPYHRAVYDAVADRCHADGAVTMLHICGRNDAILADFEATGVDLIEIDHKLELDECRRLLRPETALIGNLDPVETALKGTPREVAGAALRAIRDAGGAPSAPPPRFVLGTGCFVPLGVPLENLAAMVAVSRGHAPSREAPEPAADIAYQTHTTRSLR
jgi:uroporphyrinogen decarboxylase